MVCPFRNLRDSARAKQRHFTIILRALRYTSLFVALLLTACGTSSDAKTDMFGIIDSFIEPDGPKPWFRDGGCGPGSSGASGNPCNPYAPQDGGVPPTPDTMPPDLPKPDICVPPSTWTCKVTFSFDKQGAETTGGVHADWDVFDGVTFVTKPATLNGNKWELEITQENGKTLTYKFVVDKGLPGAKWFHDPNNPIKISDGFGGFNSQLAISCPDPCSR